METITMRKRISMEPRYLDQNLMWNLYSKIAKKTIGECTKENGYILAVTKIIQVLDNKEHVFNVEFEAEAFKPEKGKEVSGKICMLSRNGIFVEVFNIQKILLPASDIDGYTYDGKDMCLVGDDSIAVGDAIDVVIQDIQYDKTVFSCIGTIAMN